MNTKLTTILTGFTLIVASAQATIAATWICPPLRTDSVTDICRCSIGNYDTKSNEATITIFDETGTVEAGPSSQLIPPNGNFSVIANPGLTRCGCSITHQGSKGKFAASLSTKSQSGDEKAVECR